MTQTKFPSSLYILLAFLFLPVSAIAQQAADSSKLTLDRIFLSGEFRQDWFGGARWTDEGNSYTKFERSKEFKGARDIVSYDCKTGDATVLVSAAQLIPEGKEKPLSIRGYQWSHDKKSMLVFTNTKRVWRTHTKGDYWVLNTETGALKQMGIDRPESSLMFAKFSPDDKSVAYVSEHNVYIEEVSSGVVKRLTRDGSETMIYGTFDWAYEEEFQIQDGFRWSPDGDHIAFWNLDAEGTPVHLMINNTDSIYSYTIPVQYPKVGATPSLCRIGVVPARGGKPIYMNIPGDPRQNYIPRMMWTEDGNHVLALQLNRKQNHLKLWMCDKLTGESKMIYEEIDGAWIDAIEEKNWIWLNDGNEFTWLSEKDGWKHMYRISNDGKKEVTITKGDYDAVSIEEIDPEGGWAYFIASPENPTQRYLYRIPMFRKGKAERLSPMDQSGTHSYQIAPGGKYAFHTYSNINTPPIKQLISLPDHKPIRQLIDNSGYKKKMDDLDLADAEFFRVTTEDEIEMDGYMIKPPDFDPTKEYPVMFFVYGEPWSQTARDRWGISMWHYLLTQQGYIVMTLDNRGTPAPRGREWRKSIYRKIGVINSRDQAMATKEIIKWDFVDEDRISVWGWSGGGTMTLNLLFRYPELYQTGISIAPVTNQMYYDNIYQERYMGVPWENEKDFIEGSPITYAKNLEGNLFLIHGTADDNVHYQNSEALVNELIKHNKIFQTMPYPNRSHGIYEGQNTTRHLFTLMTDYLHRHVKPGPLEQGHKTKP